MIVLRKVTKIKSAKEVWLKLEYLYMTKNRSNWLFLKGMFFMFKMVEGKDLRDHIDEFNKLVVHLENTEVEYDNENKALVLVYSILKSYDDFVDILQHGRELVTLNDVVGALYSKE